MQKYGDTPKNVFSRTWQKSKDKNNPLEHYNLPICPTGPASLICTILASRVTLPT